MKHGIKSKNNSSLRCYFCGGELSKIDEALPMIFDSKLSRYRVCKEYKTIDVHYYYDNSTHKCLNCEYQYSLLNKINSLNYRENIFHIFYINEFRVALELGKVKKTYITFCDNKKYRLDFLIPVVKDYEKMYEKLKLYSLFI